MKTHLVPSPPFLLCYYRRMRCTTPHHRSKDRNTKPLRLSLLLKRILEHHRHRSLTRLDDSDTHRTVMRERLLRYRVLLADDTPTDTKTAHTITPSKENGGEDGMVEKPWGTVILHPILKKNHRMTLNEKHII